MLNVLLHVKLHFESPKKPNVAIKISLRCPNTKCGGLQIMLISMSVYHQGFIVCKTHSIAPYFKSQTPLK